MIEFIVADDHALVREGIVRILEGEPDLKCVGTANDGVEAVALVEELQPNVAIVDVTMPNMDGIEATKRIKEICPHVAVLILSAYGYADYVLACVEAGADGYILKSNIPGKGLVNAVHMVHMGSSVLDHEAINSLMLAARPKSRKVTSFGELGAREIEVLKLAAKGMTSKQIGAELYISAQTVGSHFANIFRKIEVQSRMEAVLYAMKKGWIVPQNS